MGPSGNFFRCEQNGPPTFDLWAQAFKVFRSATIMLGVLTPSTLDAYHDTVARYSARYSEKCWPMLYQTDVRGRRELVERLWRQGESLLQQSILAGPQAQAACEYKPDTAYEWIWRRLPEDTRFWRTEVEEPCLLL